MNCLIYDGLVEEVEDMAAPVCVCVCACVCVCVLASDFVSALSCFLVVLLSNVAVLVTAHLLWRVL